MERPRDTPTPRWAWPALLLGLAVGSVMWIFPRLGEDRFNIDEGIYARVVDHMRATGDWTYLEDRPGVPYLNKPPLYFWLTAATLPLTDGGRAAYRFWSAVCGVACVLLTAELGRRMFGPAVGLLSALALLFNRFFVGYHGARSACFDAALTLLALLTFLLWLDTQAGRRRWLRWGLIGLGTGAGCLLKPLGGIPVLAALGGHALLFDRGVPVRSRLAGPLLALVVGCAVAAPWYAAQWARYGPLFTYYSFQQNFVERAEGKLDPWQVRPALFYFESLTISGIAFNLALPALLWAAWRARAGAGADRFRLLVVPTGLFLLAFSASKSKLDWYLYPVYPLVAVAIAWLVWEWLPRLAAGGAWTRRWGASRLRRRFQLAAGGGVERSGRR